MNHHNTGQKKEPRIAKTIRSDWRTTKIREEFKSEYKDLKQYFLTEDRRKKLSGMNILRRFFILPFWLTKAMYFRLTPFRRILFFIGLIGFITFADFHTGADGTEFTLNVSAVFTALVFLFILALELKDKLLARTELEEGRAIQLSLMPERSPEFPGWDIWLFTRSANDVGGDLLDFIPINENKFGVAVGDVAGKGLSAALLMAKLQSSIRALIYDYSSLAKLGNSLNKIFHRDSLPKIFASLVYIEINNESGIVKFINAGHYPPVIVQKNKIVQLKKVAPALGLLPDAPFTEQNISLNQNDFMIIYSDGLTEAQNETGEFFGEVRLNESLMNAEVKTSQQLGEMILSHIDFFIGKTPAHDDLTLAILKKTT